MRTIETLWLKLRIAASQVHNVWLHLKLRWKIRKAGGERLTMSPVKIWQSLYQRRHYTPQEAQEILDQIIY